jgi:hypothetical protein
MTKEDLTSSEKVLFSAIAEKCPHATEEWILELIKCKPDNKDYCMVCRHEKEDRQN